MGYEHILIDLDNTILDFDKTEHLSLEQTFKFVGYEDGDRFVKTYETINKKLWNDLEKGKITADLINITRFKILHETLSLQVGADQIAAFYKERLSNTICYIDDAERILKYLSSKYKLVLATNGFSVVQRTRMKITEFDKYFEHMAISEEIGKSKPENDFFTAALKFDKNINKNYVLMIGDNLRSDIVGGINFGIDTCWFNLKHENNYSDIEPTYTISKLSDLCTIL